MTTLVSAPHQDFIERLTALYQQSAGHPAMDKLRAKAWERFLALGLPDVAGLGTYQYVRLRSLYTTSYVQSALPKVELSALLPHLLPECQQSRIVLVNGRFSEALSDLQQAQGLVVLPLQEALRPYGAFLNNRWTRWMRDEPDPFAALNGALCQEALFLYIPPRVRLEQPLQVINLIKPSHSPESVMPRLQIFAGAHSSASFAFTMVAPPLASEVWLNQVIDYVLEEGASVRHTQILEEMVSGWLLNAIRASLKRDSSFNAVCLNEGSKTVRNDYRLFLNGENAEANLEAAWMTDQNTQSHQNVFIRHQAPHCRSRQLFKGILKGSSKASFEGKIYVDQEAQKTDAFQLNNNLILSEEATAYSKPNLEIFADDVKASHGSTTGQLDDEALFYLRSRGLTAQQAQGLLVQAFLQEIVDKIPLISLHQYVQNRRVQRYA